MNRLSLPSIVVAIALIAAPLRAQTDTLVQKDKAIRAIIEMKNIRETTTESLKSSLADMRESLSSYDGSGKWVDQFGSKIDSMVSLLIDSVVPIYAHYYSLHDLQQLTEMMQSPIMQYSQRVAPAIADQMEGVGKRIGKEVMTKIVSADVLDDSDATDTTPAETKAPARKSKGKK